MSNHLPFFRLKQIPLSGGGQGCERLWVLQPRASPLSPVYATTMAHDRLYVRSTEVREGRKKKQLEPRERGWGEKGELLKKEEIIKSNDGAKNAASQDACV